MSGNAKMRGPISVAIFDLDNTLWDWVELWCRSFRAMLDRLVQDSGVPEDQLVPEIKTVHERYGTSEYAFLIEELPSLQRQHPGEDLARIYDGAIKAYREERLKALALYPGVLETLETIRDAGALIIGFTDSRAFYTASRMRRLGLDRIFEYLYSPPDHELPGGKAPEHFRMYPKESYELRRTEHRHIPENERKPNPDILLQIMREVGATPEEVVYVGDSLMKDMAMAQQAGVLGAWAKYGLAQQRPDYELLRRVTHWTASAVEKEKALKEEEVLPALVLENGLADLLQLCQFAAFRSEPEREKLMVEREKLVVERDKLLVERDKLVVDIWKKAIDVQQHFNDLEMRIRNYAVTLLIAIVGASAFSLKENLRISVSGLNISVAATLLVAGAFSWLAFYFMDRFWYHRLLYGAVKHAEVIERRWQERLPELGLTGTIGRESPVTLFGVQLHSPGKIDLFYSIVFGLTLLIAIALQYGTGGGSKIAAQSTPTPIPTVLPTVAPTTPRAPTPAVTVPSVPNNPRPPNPGVTPP